VNYESELNYEIRSLFEAVSKHIHTKRGIFSDFIDFCGEANRFEEDFGGLRGRISKRSTKQYAKTLRNFTFSCSYTRFAPHKIHFAAFLLPIHGEKT
jgi:hypothetical protein